MVKWRRERRAYVIRRGVGWGDVLFYGEFILLSLLGLIWAASR